LSDFKLLAPSSFLYLKASAQIPPPKRGYSTLAEAAESGQPKRKAAVQSFSITHSCSVPTKMIEHDQKF
jgi:hypothetical protein